MQKKVGFPLLVSQDPDCAWDILGCKSNFNDAPK